MDRFIETEGLSHIALNIITNLDAVSLARFRLVCKSWCMYVTRSRFWWVTLFLQFELKTKTIERIEGENGYYKLMKRNHKRWKYWKKSMYHFGQNEDFENREKLGRLLLTKVPFAKDKLQGNVEPLPNLENNCPLFWDRKLSCFILFCPHEIEFLRIIDEIYEDGTSLLAEKIISSSYDECDYSRAFILAVIQGMHNLIDVLGHKLIKEGIDLNKPLPNTGNLHLCFHAPIVHILVICSMKREHIIDTLSYFLNDLGIDINARDNQGRTILHRFSLLEQNFRPGRDLKSWYENGLQEDFTSNQDYKGEDDLFNFILNQRNLNINALVTHPNSFRDSPLFSAIQFNNDDWVQAMLHRNDIDFNMVDSSGKSPIIYACREGRLNIVKTLLSLDDSLIDSRDARSGSTLLHHVIECNSNSESEELLKFLLTKLDVNITDNNGKTPLHYFCSKSTRWKDKAMKMLHILLEQPNIDVNARATFGYPGNLQEKMTPLHICGHSWSTAIDNEETVKLLLERDDIQFDAQNSAGETPLDLVDEFWHPNVKALLEEYKLIRDFYKLSNLFT